MNGYDISVVISDGFEDVSAEVKRNTPELEAELDMAGGIPVENGATFIPSVSKEGVISWTNDKDLPNPEPVNIKGDPGKNGYTPVKGKDYFDGEPGKPGYTPVKGKDYFDGAPGAPGVSATHKWNGTVLYITSASGTSSADLKGEKGNPGKTPVKGVDYFDGEPGYTPVKGKDYFDGKDGYTPVKGKDYFDGEPGKTPVKGTDYFTDADKAEMVSAVISALPKYDGEVVAV